jgi:HSP20 family molecular chaperone IbpA
MAAMSTMGLAPVLPPNAHFDESKEEYVVHLAVPGFALEELDIEIADGVVAICGDQTETGVDTRPFCLHERLEERFALPGDVDAARVTASYSHGEIELHAPRTNGFGPEPRKVPIMRRFAINPDASGV